MPRLNAKHAAVARKSWQERAELWREKIRVAQIINRLHSYVESDLAPKGYVLLPIKPTKELLAGMDEETYSQVIEIAGKTTTGIEMSPSQVKAAQVLLDRVMPTLSASEVTTKKESITPAELVEVLRQRYGDEFANKIHKDYVPDQPTHEAGHA